MLHSFKAEMSHFVYLGHYVGNTMMRDALASHITQRFAGIVEIVMGHRPWVIQELPECGHGHSVDCDSDCVSFHGTLKISR